MDHNYNNNNINNNNSIANNNDLKGQLIIRKSKIENNLNKEITKVNKIHYKNNSNKTNYSNNININIIKIQDFNIQIGKNRTIKKKIIYNNPDDFDKTIILELDSDIISLRSKETFYLEFKSKIKINKKKKIN